MIQTFIDVLRILAGQFAATPVQFTLGTFIFVTLIYYKWVWIGRVQRNTVKRTFAGWTVDGEIDDADRLVMRPVQMRKVSLWVLAFFGGGAVFMALVEVPKPDVDAERWFVFCIQCGFSALGIWLFLMSFTRITFDGAVFTQRGPLVRTLARRADQLSAVHPLSKTLAVGVYLYFGEQDRIRVPANMSGYRQLLEILSRHDPVLRSQVAAFADAFGRHL